MLALGLDSGRVMLVDEATGEEKWARKDHSKFGSISGHVAISPGTGRFVASMGFNDERWTLWDAASGAVHRVGATHDGTGDCICTVPIRQEGCPVVAHTGGMRVVAFSPCGHRLASGGWDGAVIVWDAEKGEALLRMQGDAKGSSSLSFSADGARLASGTSSGAIHVWNATTGALIRTTPAVLNYFVGSVSFSPIGNHILASGGGGVMSHIWDVDSGEKIRSIGGRWFVEFSPDGRSIATASATDGREVNLMDVQSGAVRVRMVGHLEYVRCASFSPTDGSRLASGSNDGTCRVWDSSTGALLRTINLQHAVLSGKPSTLNPQPSTLNPQPSTLNPQPANLNPQPSTLNPQPSPSTINFQSHTVSWGRDWVRDTQVTLPCLEPYTLHPTP